MKYYIVSLKYNKNSNKTKIGNVKEIVHTGLMMDNEYESVPVIAYESYSLYSSYLVDVLSGKRLFSDSENVPNIKYVYKREASENEIIKIAEIYRSLTKDDINRYIMGIKEIEVYSINKYNESMSESEKAKNSLKNANNYLTTLVIEK